MPDDDSLKRGEALRRFGGSLAHLRARSGLTQESLAGLAGLHRTYVGSVERGERNPTLITILKLADALGCAPADFFNEVGAQ